MRNYEECKRILNRNLEKQALEYNITNQEIENMIQFMKSNNNPDESNDDLAIRAIDEFVDNKF